MNLDLKHRKQNNMTTEEKARAYDEALKRAKLSRLQLLNIGEEATEIEYIFPEIVESEDELTWLTKYIEEEAHSLSIDIRDNEDRIKLKKLQRSLDWLKKQGEQKPKKVWKHWKDGIAGGSEDEQIFLIKIGRVYTISSCLGCECDYIELSELDKLLREEKQEKSK